MENNIEYIQTVQISGEGYLVNGSIYIPKSDGNRHYRDLKVWLETNEPEPEFTDEELKLLEEKESIWRFKYEGILYPSTEYMISFTSEDALALMQVKAAFELGVQSTNIKFSNGTIMPMTQDKFLEFAEWFVNQRNQFFI